MKSLSLPRFALVLAALASASMARAEPVRIYVDASRSGGARLSGIAIERGIRTALSEVENQLGGRPVELVIKDHRGSSPRSRRHLEEFLEDENALAVFSGLHSPPVLAHLAFINENGILMLDPWAAAGPITRYPSAENSVFRLSVDDRKAGIAIARYSTRDGFRRPALVLEETGWGDSNRKSMGAALEELGITSAGTWRFPWGLSRINAREMVAQIKAAGADVIFMVSNEEEGRAIVSAVASLPASERLPIRSHWGITGGDFVRDLGFDVLAAVDLRFLQTRFSFKSEPLGAHARGVLDRSARLFPQEPELETIPAPVGFIHAYDLTRLLIASVDAIGLSGQVRKDRARVRRQLEKIDGPIQGLIKTYRRPFRAFSPDDPDAHEALGLEDLRMAQFGPGGEIFLLPDATPPAAGKPE